MHSVYSGYNCANYGCDHCSEHGCDNGANNWGFNFTGNGLLGGWLSRYLSILGRRNADLCCNDYRNNCDNHRDHRDHRDHRNNCSEHGCNNCDHCNNLWNRRAKPGWNVGVQHG